MKKYLSKIRKIWFYSGIEKKDYELVAKDIYQANRRLLLTLSLVVAIALVIMSGFSFYVDSLVKNRTLYIGCALLMFMIFGLCHFDNEAITYAMVYLFLGILFAFGIMMGTFIDPDNVTVSFVVLLFAAPLVFCDRPCRIDLAIIAGTVAYLICAKITQSNLIFGYNCTNVIPYSIISLFTVNFMNGIKVQRYLLANQNRFLSQRDQLTGLYNRRMFDQKLTEIDGLGGYVLFAFDINGLKRLNDNVGHHAGDELIVNAAKYIKEVFGAYGECYRTGGDEFFAIVQMEQTAIEEVMKNLEDRCKAWKGELSDKLSISCGSAVSSEGVPSVELVIIADKQMYKSKADYYRQSGNDRRKG